MEQFCDKINDGLRYYLADKNFTLLDKMSTICDEYIAVHKTGYARNIIDRYIKDKYSSDRNKYGYDKFHYSKNNDRHYEKYDNTNSKSINGVYRSIADDNVRDAFADESRNTDSCENRGGKNSGKRNERNRTRSEDGKDTNNDFSKPANKVLCYYCRQPGYKKSDCPKKKNDDALLTGFAQSDIGMRDDYVITAVIIGKGGMQFCVPHWRDTGAQVS